MTSFCCFSKESGNSFQKGGKTHTAYVRGFDKSLGVDEVLLPGSLTVLIEYILYA